MELDAQSRRVVSAFFVRPATQTDVPALGKMAGALVRMHHAMDPERFMIREPIEEGYGRWLGKQAEDKDAVVVVAERDGEIVGYAYGALEERDWMQLRDACGALHDVLVVESARRSGIARALCLAVIARLGELGAPRVVLTTAAKNEGAQRLFASLGFRQTMIEMTREATQSA
jgi:ribosomal protein S18 acetylase RimI-like enzyme